LSGLEYTFWQKALHGLVLGSRLVSEFSLDLEIGRTKVDLRSVEQARHVFIAGLARSGTTILMRRFYDTGAFVSLTYRDMPFVLMPLFWKRISGNSSKSMVKVERAHGDGLMVDYDSPEAFEEVFWKTVSGPEYLRKNMLMPHHPDGGTMKRFKQYIGVILKSRGGISGKYLSKNNNNILRLGALVSALPHSVFLVPFREPRQQAWSLLRQHRRFQARDDPFTNKYMGWLGHYEFGPNHRPFRMTSDENIYDPGDLSYWLFLWNSVYRRLVAEAPKEVLFVSYEELCGDHNQTWARLKEIAGVEVEARVPESLNLKERLIHEPFDQGLLRTCQETHHLLMERHQAVLSR
jgi:hypothetical protein